MIIYPAPLDNLPLIGCIIAGILYWLGGRQRLMLITPRGVKPARSTKRAWRSVAFYAALAVTAFALQPPMDTWADQLFWVHMVQHQLLLMVAAPLFILAAPWIRLWSGFALDIRRPVARGVVQGAWAKPLRAAARFFANPLVAWVLFNAILIGWHVPFLYDAAVQNQGVHDAEHITFLVFALIFWGQLFDSPPFHSRLDYMRRFFYLAGSMFPSWILALVMVFSGAPLYPIYVVIESGHSGVGALADQQIAGAIMWMLGSIPMAITGFWLIYQWVLTTAEPGAKRRRRPRVSAAVIEEPAGN